MNLFKIYFLFGFSFLCAAEQRFPALSPVSQSSNAPLILCNDSEVNNHDKKSSVTQIQSPSKNNLIAQSNANVIFSNPSDPLNPSNSSNINEVSPSAATPTEGIPVSGPPMKMQKPSDEIQVNLYEIKQLAQAVRASGGKFAIDISIEGCDLVKFKESLIKEGFRIVELPDGKIEVESSDYNQNFERLKSTALKLREDRDRYIADTFFLQSIQNPQRVIPERARISVPSGETQAMPTIQQIPIPTQKTSNIPTSLSQAKPDPYVEQGKQISTPSNHLSRPSSFNTQAVSSSYSKQENEVKTPFQVILIPNK